MVSDALRRMKEAHDSGGWRACPDAAMLGVLAFTEAVDPSMLMQDEYEFVTGFMAVMCEHNDDQAKGGA